MNKKIIVSLIILAVIIVGAFVVTNYQYSTTDYNRPPYNLGQTSATSTQNINPATTTYTLSDVAKHNTKTDCWLAINGSVLNVTDFIASGKHNPKIIEGCGLDATSMFSKVDKHSGSQAQSLMQSFIIGKLK